jgi:hypothetical protein
VGNCAGCQHWQPYDEREPDASCAQGVAIDEEHVPATFGCTLYVPLVGIRTYGVSEWPRAERRPGLQIHDIVEAFSDTFRAETMWMLNEDVFLTKGLSRRG